jgi:hypothetical protein
LQDSSYENSSRVGLVEFGKTQTTDCLKDATAEVETKEPVFTVLGG